MMIDPKQILALCEKATPGPWEYCQFESDLNEFGVHCPQFDGAIIENGITNNALTVCRGMTGPNKVNNAEFIALARTALPELTQRVLELEREIDPYWMNKAQELESEVIRLREIEVIAKDACEELEGHGLYAIQRLSKALEAGE